MLPVFGDMRAEDPLLTAALILELILSQNLLPGEISDHLKYLMMICEVNYDRRGETI